MPRLLLLVPCNNVLISQGEAASLIVLMHQLRLKGVPSPIPENSVVPMQWFVFAQWETDASEVGIRFEQKFEIVSTETGAPVGFEGFSEFVPEAGKPLHRMVGEMRVFPLLAQGHYRLRIFIRQSGQETWNQGGDYPLELIHAAAEAS